MNIEFKKPSPHLHVHHLPATQPNDVCFVWAHGWMRSHRDFITIANQLTACGDHYLIDLPGHGETSKSCGNWCVEEYLKPIASWVNSLDKPIIWVGHSFGCRIGLHMARLLPEKIHSLHLICPPFNYKNYLSSQFLKKILYKTIYRAGLFLGLPREKLISIFGSKDYQSAKTLRVMLSNWLNDDTKATVSKITVPIYLLFGSHDLETPHQLSQHFLKANPKANISILNHFDHYTILTDGQHQIIHHLTEHLGQQT